MTDLTPDHPAVEALVAGLGFEDRPEEVLTDAVHNLTADDLRHLPEGRKLMAEVWQEGAMAHASATSHMSPETRRIINELMRAANPYLEARNE